MINASDLTAAVADVATVQAGLSEAELIERIAVLERLKSAAAAGQARATAALDAGRRADEAAAGCRRRCAAGVWPVRWPWRGGTPRHAAGAIWAWRRRWSTRCPTRWRPHCGRSEWRATLLVRESACLGVEHRRRLDAELCADRSDLEGLGDARLTAAAKAVAYRLDPKAVVDRAAKAPTTGACRSVRRRTP